MQDCRVYGADKLRASQAATAATLRRASVVWERQDELTRVPGMRRVGRNQGRRRGFVGQRPRGTSINSTIGGEPTLPARPPITAPCPLPSTISARFEQANIGPHCACCLDRRRSVAVILIRSAHRILHSCSSPLDMHLFLLVGLLQGTFILLHGLAPRCCFGRRTWADKHQAPDCTLPTPH